MQTRLKRAVLLVWMLGLALPAMAGMSASLIVHNDFDGKANCFVDGRLMGTLVSGETEAFALAPGTHRVKIERPGGFDLINTRVDMQRGCAVNLHVIAPLTQLTVHNQGAAPLRVDLDNGDGVWLDGGSAATMAVPAGSVKMVASTRTRIGTVELERRTVWLEPGVATTTAFAIRHNAARDLALTNHHHRAVRVLVEGRDRGRLEAGATMRIEVMRERAQVMLVEIGGATVYSGIISLEAGVRNALILKSRHHVRIVRSAEKVHPVRVSKMRLHTPGVWFEMVSR
jgi:hypothetical protein